MSGDCDDARAEVRPGVADVCNARDDDCDGTIDEDQTTTLFADLDGDGHGGVDGVSIAACELTEGFAASADDCDDMDAATFPAATEQCDGVDNDCDGAVDEDAVDAVPWYLDGDGDGHGRPDARVWACDAPVGVAVSGDDCDDARDGVHPGAGEACATLSDDDCDGSTNDQDAIGCTLTYADDDGDGYGDTSRAACLCRLEAPFVARSAGDCDDTRGERSPGVPEDCATPEDDDCDGALDAEGALGCTYFYADADGDGWGAEASASCRCEASVSHPVSTDGDCDDGDSRVRPDAVETCDGRDEDCDSAVDDDPEDGAAWFEDADGDGHAGSVVVTVACESPPGVPVWVEEPAKEALVGFLIEVVWGLHFQRRGAVEGAAA